MAVTFASGGVAIGCCDRCKKERPYAVLIPDGDKPALRVCPPELSPGCWDVFDPWRLPPRQLEAIALRFPRPDVPLTGPDQTNWDTSWFWDDSFVWDEQTLGQNNLLNDGTGQ